MEVNGVGLQTPSIIQTKTIQANTDVEETSAHTPESPEVQEPVEAQQQEDDGSETKGVIQNLLNGHFKGVADVRLRINHFEELSAIESGQQKVAADEKITDLLNAVDSVVSNIPEPSVSTSSVDDEAPEETTEDEIVTIASLHEEFINAVNLLNEEFQAAQSPSAVELVAGIESAFDMFVGSLRELLAITIEEDEPASQDGDDTTDQEPEVLPGTVQDPVSELKNVFTTAANELNDALKGSQALPELSQPSGNGIAYNKFLETYNELYGIQSSNEAAYGYA
jgi:hypothetical protein